MFIENFLIPLLIGGISFGALNWISNPYFEFLNIRKEIHVTLIDLANIWSVKNDHDEERAYAGHQKIRTLSAQLTALDHSLNPTVRWILYSVREMDLKKAADSLMIYHNDFMDQNKLRTKMRKEIEEALRLPKSS